VFFLLLLPASGASLDEIKKRGSIVIGVKSDYKPWGYIDDQGKFAGMEIELARDIARRLYVEPVLTPVLASNRIQLLDEGKIDLILATFSVTEERKKQVLFIEPGYYAAMTAILTRAKSGFAKEVSLKGRTICGIAGMYSNKAVEVLAGGALLETKTLPEAEEMLRAGKCEGISYDDVVLLYLLKSGGEEWEGYDITLLLGVTPATWGLAVPLSEKGGGLANFLSATVKDWHRDGTLLKLEKKWVGDNSMALQWLSAKVRNAGIKSIRRRPVPSKPRIVPSLSERF
jgi:polar amino acid transport system substrate-binding protein